MTLPDNLVGKRKHKRNHLDVLSIIRDILEKENHPPSLKMLAKKAGMPVGYLAYRFPDIVRNVVEQHKKLCEKRKEEKRALAKQFALDFF